jgi:hypothetical protein
MKRKEQVRDVTEDKDLMDVSSYEPLPDQVGKVSDESQSFWIANTEQEKLLEKLILSKDKPFINTIDDDDEYSDMDSPRNKKPESTRPPPNPDEIPFSNMELSLIDPAEKEISEISTERVLIMINLYQLHIDHNRSYSDKTYRRGQYLKEYLKVIRWLESMFVLSSPKLTDSLDFKIDGYSVQERANVYEFILSDQPILYFTCSVLTLPFAQLIRKEPDMARWRLRLHSDLECATCLDYITPTHTLKPLIDTVVMPNQDMRTSTPSSYEEDAIEKIRKSLLNNYLKDLKRTYFWIKYDMRAVKNEYNTKIDPHHTEALAVFANVHPIIQSRKEDEERKKRKEKEEAQKKQSLTSNSSSTGSTTKVQPSPQIHDVLPKSGLSKKKVVEEIPSSSSPPKQPSQKVSIQTSIQKHLFCHTCGLFLKAHALNSMDLPSNNTIGLKQILSTMMKEEKPLRLNATQWSLNDCHSQAINAEDPIPLILEKEIKVDNSALTYENLIQMDNFTLSANPEFDNLYNQSTEYVISLITTFVVYKLLSITDRTLNSLPHYKDHQQQQQIHQQRNKIVEQLEVDLTLGFFGATLNLFEKAILLNTEEKEFVSLGKNVLETLLKLYKEKTIPLHEMYSCLEIQQLNPSATKDMITKKHVFIQGFGLSLPQKTTTTTTTTSILSSPNDAQMVLENTSSSASMVHFGATMQIRTSFLPTTKKALLDVEFPNSFLNSYLLLSKRQLSLLQILIVTLRTFGNAVITLIPNSLEKLFKEYQTLIGGDGNTQDSSNSFTEYLFSSEHIQKLCSSVVEQYFSNQHALISLCIFSCNKN